MIQSVTVTTTTITTEQALGLFIGIPYGCSPDIKGKKQELLVKLVN